jgi:hypothetical protein
MSKFFVACSWCSASAIISHLGGDSPPHPTSHPPPPPHHPHLEIALGLVYLVYLRDQRRLFRIPKKPSSLFTTPCFEGIIPRYPHNSPPIVVYFCLYQKLFTIADYFLRQQSTLVPLGRKEYLRGLGEYEIPSHPQTF